MEAVRIKMAGVWVCVMLIYLLGDVLRIMSGDSQKLIESGDMSFTPMMWYGISVLMLLPILMVYGSLALPYDICRWANILMAGFFLVFNLVGIGGYPSAYDPFLLVVSMIFNGISIWHAWHWTLS